MAHDGNNQSSLGPAALLAAAVSTTIAAVVVSVTGTSGSHVRLTEVPKRWAAPNAAQVALAHEALKVGVQSRTVYVWGGASPRGFDCSGFTQYVYAHAIGVLIPRTSESQWFSDSGVKVPLQRERMGDLVFFSGAFGSRSSPGHVGLYLGNGRYTEFYHSGARARISTLSEFSRGYLGAKRWYTPARVPSRLLNYTVMLAHKYNRRIINSFTQPHWKRWAIDYVPHSKRMFRWAKKNHLKVLQLPHRTRLFLKPFPR